MAAAAAVTAPGVAGSERHPKGLYVLFLVEMWERFSFYTVGGMWALYVQHQQQGFGWERSHATNVWSYYQMCVYASPLIGGLLADWKIGYRRAVMLGGLFFMAGHGLLAVRSIPVMFLALACLVVGNGLFKPNVSTMVGNLYPEGSRLKDQAYNIFYMGINVGAFLAPIVAEFMSKRFGYHPAFAMGALGMLLSVSILWRYGSHVASADRKKGEAAPAPAAGQAKLEIDSVSDKRRIFALIVMFVVVIVFWMVFHQNQTTLTYWANDNTDWNVSGIISNSINPGWVIVLTFPLLWFWRKLAERGMEPSTPTKMAIGMVLTGAAFFVMYFAGKAGGDTGKVSPAWLFAGYGVLTLGELMLSPMGLSLVSKVAPQRFRGILMGGWFAAIAIGNKLTAIGVFWDEWLHSTFFAVLGTCALAMAVVLALLLKPLKRAMPGV